MNELTLEPASAQDPRIGSVLADRYRVVRKLGEGGMGIVYEGIHTVIGRRVAIKMLHPQFATSADVVARFHREAIAATAIGHPHIVEVIDMARAEDGAVFMVLELLDGRDWAHDLAATGPQSLGRVARILTAVCDALAAAHAKKIVHRDLKPENVFLIARQGDPDFVKLVDFGISKMLDESSGGKGLTQTGAAMGTPYYMAPEQMSGRKDIDHRADLYAVGVMLYQAVTGSYPFDGETLAMLALKVISTEPPPLSELMSEVPEGLQAVIDRTLAKEPKDRFANAAELQVALARWLDDPRTPALRASRSELPTLPIGASGDASAAAALRATRPASTREMPGQLSVTPRVATSTIPAEGPTPSASLPRVALLTGAILVALLAAFALSRPSSGETASEGISHTPPITTPLAVEDPPRVHIVIATTPPNADLRLDGLAIANPFDGELAASREPHHLEARADGRSPIDREITLLTDQRITLTLEVLAPSLVPPSLAEVPSVRPHHTPRDPEPPPHDVAPAPTTPVVVAPPRDPPPSTEGTTPASERLLKRPF